MNRFVTFINTMSNSLQCLHCSIGSAISFTSLTLPTQSFRYTHTIPTVFRNTRFVRPSYWLKFHVRQCRKMEIPPKAQQPYDGTSQVLNHCTVYVSATDLCSGCRRFAVMMYNGFHIGDNRGHKQGSPTRPQPVRQG